MTFRPPREISAHRMNATAFHPNRKAMVQALKARLPEKPRVIEVGVGLGDFSQFLLETLGPRQFVGIDNFGLHEIGMLWGRPTSEIFGGRTHEQFYRDRFAGKPVDVGTGVSWEVLAGLDEGAFDLVYVDAGHDYDSVLRDLDESLRVLAPAGIIIANDYTMYDPFLRVDYGVVQAVNEFVEARDFELVGFALECNMFCDVAFRRMGQR